MKKTVTNIQFYGCGPGLGMEATGRMMDGTSLATWRPDSDQVAAARDLLAHANEEISRRELLSRARYAIE